MKEKNFKTFKKFLKNNLKRVIIQPKAIYLF